MKNLREMKCKRGSHNGYTFFPNADGKITNLKYSAAPKHYLHNNTKYLKYFIKDGSVEKFKITY